MVPLLVHLCAKTPQEPEDQHYDVMKKMFGDKFAKRVAQVVNVTEEVDVEVQ